MHNVLIVEDVAQTREWLAECVRKAFDDCDIREAADKRGGVYAAKGLPIDLAIIDLGLPDGHGVDVIAAVKEHHPNAMTVVATVMGDDNSIISALSAGAQGYLLKDSPPDLFIAQLRQHMQGIPALSPSVARRIVEHFKTTATPLEKDMDGAADLTNRETEVLSLVGRGYRNTEAADTLGVSETTIASHIKSIYAKLGIRNRAEAAIRAQKLGLTRS